MAAQPIQIAGRRGRAGDHHEAILGQAREGQIGLNPTGRVQPLGINRPAWRDRHVIGRDILQQGLGVRPFNPEFRETAEVEEGGAFAHRPMLGGRQVKPVLPPIAVAVGGRRRGVGVEPIGPFPAGGLAETCAGGGQAVVQRRMAHAARRRRLPVRPMHGVKKAQRLGRAVV